VKESWALSGDLAAPWLIAAGALALVSLVLLGVELWRARRGAVVVAATGLLALTALLLAVMRPVRISERGAAVGARVVVLVDASRSIDLPADERQRTRRDVIAELLPRLGERFREVRAEALSFGIGEPAPLPGLREGGAGFNAPPQLGSDLAAALQALASSTEQLPQAIVVVSDGRLDRPDGARTAEQLEASVGALAVPIHTVSVARQEPRDASVRSVRMAHAVVAHQAVVMKVEVACSGGLGCNEVPVTARELHLASPPVKRAAGVARSSGNVATVELEVTLDRAGTRILEVSIDAPEGDEIEANDRRFLTVEVARDRVRLLHVAGRPTYDVRALRTWLKSDASVDVVAFFILRTHDDDVAAPQDELALIPFPVDELFTVHLASFDAVVLQDFDSVPYGLAKHLPALTRYVMQGGGLIMVGGPNAFVSGNYAQTELASVLPVGMNGIGAEDAIDLASFVPRVSSAGKHAPVLEPLLSLIGEQLPEMPGTNVVADARDGATVLLEHPTHQTAGRQPMPVLALGEYGSGRSIALTVDGSHKLLFSNWAADAAGRAHGAFWDAMLGWLMRDPRFEPARARLPNGCIAGVDTTLEIRSVFVEEGAEAEVVVTRMGSGKEVVHEKLSLPGSGAPLAVPLGKLGAGGYTASIRLVRQAESAPSHYDFACEAGGPEWADPRPDVERLAAIARVTGGVHVDAAAVEELPLPEAADVVSERRVRALLPPWAWTLLAAVCLGLHWLVRRRAGLS
jgi:uncharacterized membrane protein